MKGIGIDIESISNFSQKKFENNISFYKKIFTNAEIEYCLNRSDPYQHFTAHFCAKEAAIKALVREKIKLTEIEVKIDKKRSSLIIPNEKNVLVSMSYTKKYATAIVMIE